MTQKWKRDRLITTQIQCLPFLLKQPDIEVKVASEKNLVETN